MRQGYVHQAVLRMAPGAASGAPGAAVTLALCGAWDHEPPCPLAPHHTATASQGETTTVRVLYAAEPGQADAVRALIEEALARGEATGPDGVASHWALVGGHPGEVRLEERELLARLADG